MELGLAMATILAQTNRADRQVLDWQRQVSRHSMVSQPLHHPAASKDLLLATPYFQTATLLPIRNQGASRISLPGEPLSPNTIPQPIPRSRSQQSPTILSYCKTSNRSSLNQDFKRSRLLFLVVNTLNLFPHQSQIARRTKPRGRFLEQHVLITPTQLGNLSADSYPPAADTSFVHRPEPMAQLLVRKAYKFR